MSDKLKEINGAKIIKHPDDGKPCCNETNAAIYLRMKRTTLRNYLYKYDGVYKLPSHKILKQTYIYLDDIKAFYERTRNKPSGAPNEEDKNNNKNNIVPLSEVSKVSKK